jgi:hypothetical protein
MSPISKIVRVSAGQVPLSNAQKKFNRLVAQIGKERQLLEEWQDVAIAFRQRCGAEIDPVLMRIGQRKLDFVILLDKANSEIRFSRKESRKLRDILAELTSQLCDPAASEELKRLYTRYNGVDFDKELAKAEADLSQFLGEPLPGEEDPFPPLDEAAGEAAQRKYGEPQEARPATPRERAYQEKMDHAAQAMKQTVREVYRKLASALHPDREPDDAKRVRKTCLMQRANAAYAAGNLLDLLEMQLELEHIDQHALNSTSADRLKHYNDVLAEQSRELRQAVRETIHWLQLDYCLEPRDIRTPALALNLLDKDLKAFQRELAWIEDELASLADVTSIKAWIKAYDLEPSWDDDFAGFDAVLAALNGRPGPAPSGH